MSSIYILFYDQLRLLLDFVLEDLSFETLLVYGEKD